MTDLCVKLAGVELKNPIVAASGTIGFGREASEFFDLFRLGALCVKGLTLHPRTGNPPPRIAETPMGLLNSVGLQNPGVDTFCREEMPFLRGCGTKIFANISGGTEEEFEILSEKVSQAGVDLIEANISCPNVKCEGLAWGTSPQAAAAATAAVKRHAAVPVLVKLSPNVTDIAEIARAVEEAGADGISLINTLLGMRIDPETRRPILHQNVGGLSGPAVLPVAVRMIWQTARAVHVPILGMGGVMTGRDGVELMLAGASAVAVGTASLCDPSAPARILEELRLWCEAHGVERVSSLTGAVKSFE